MKLTDTSPMPFGKYMGLRMEAVPASYLHWLWVNGGRGGPLKELKPGQSNVADYIRDNMTALKYEHPDGEWH